MKKISLIAMLVLFWSSASAEEDARKAMKPLNLLIGSWKGAGILQDEKKSNWQEVVKFEWKFKDKEAWIAIDIENGKLFRKGEIRTGSENRLVCILETADKKKLEYTGALKEKQLTFERKLTNEKLIERVVFSLLHDNRIVYRTETKPESGTIYTRRAQVGLTKEGVDFVDKGVSERECVVSGGLGTIAVSYKGKTYYVCCSGCRDEFNAEPAKYLKEFEEKRKQAGKK